MYRNNSWIDNLFDEWFDFPTFGNMDHTEQKLYGKHADRLMKTDVRENENDYEVDIDLPGFKKDEIKLELTDGYLTVSAAKGLNEDEKEEKTGRWIRQERYVGAMQRSFYVGEALTEEDIKASFKDGVLALTVPKKTAKLPEKKTILIEG